MTTGDDNNHSVIKMEASLDISCVNDFCEECKHAISAGHRITIDASAVEQVDTAVIQVLCAMFKDRKKHNISLGWLSPSVALRAAAQQLGLEQVLELT